MNKYIIRGGGKLNGEVEISGSKNAALPIMAASILTDDDVIINNFPYLRDIQTMISLLVLIGKKVIIEQDRLIVQNNKPLMSEAPYEIVKKMRASIVVLGPLLAKTGRARVSLPGGCAIGPRPIDLHIKGLKCLGADIDLEHGYIEASGALKGAVMDLTGKFGSTVLGTDNILMAACLAEGKTIIEGAAKEPETVDLAGFLKAMGAKIKGEGTSNLEIEGVNKLHGCEYTVIPDRIEAGTFMIVSAITRSNLILKNLDLSHLKSVTEVLQSTGVKLKGNNKSLQIITPKELKGFSIETLPYPKFPTDMAPQFTALACTIREMSSVTEVLFPNRFNHIPEMQRMGAEIRIEDNTAIINGRENLDGASIQASDLRAGAALVCAALAAKGESEVRRIYHVERGYENLPHKLQKIGANILIESDEII